MKAPFRPRLHFSTDGAANPHVPPFAVMIAPPKEPMAHPFVFAALAAVLILVIIVIWAYRMTRRDPPGHYDRKPPTPGFRSKRGRGR